MSVKTSSAPRRTLPGESADQHLQLDSRAIEAAKRSIEEGAVLVVLD